jgi:putative radical SAM enzyme (TIGR03279 family)
MNGEVRAKMLRTPLASKIQTHLDRLQSSGVEYHTQVVLCPNLNDGKELDYTISEILKRRPFAQSLAIVPVGVTKHRRDKFPLTQFDKDGAAKVIEQVEKFQKKSRADSGKTFVYLGDEFYFLAGKKIPPAEYYDDFPQIENGIGMTRNFIDEFHGELGDRKQETGDRVNSLKIDVISGTSISIVLKDLADEEMRRNKNLDVRILPVVNEFFGSKINVSGLLTGGDIINTLKKNSRPCDKILIPATALRSGTETFLDDVTVDDMRKIFPAKFQAIHNGGEFLQALR